MLLTTFDAFISCATDIVASSKWCKVSSYNWTYNPNFQSKLLDFTLSLKGKDAKVLVGIGSRECTEGCPHCRDNIEDKVNGISTLRDYLHPVELRAVADSHLKLVCTKKYSIIGGINMTGSGWADAAVKVKTTPEIIQLFDESWNNTKPFELAPRKEIIGYTNPDEWCFNFGKHKGKTLLEVRRECPDYISWCKVNLTWFKKAILPKPIYTTTEPF